MKKFIITMMLMATAMMAVGCTINAGSAIDDVEVTETSIISTENHFEMETEREEIESEITETEIETEEVETETEEIIENFQ